MKQRLAFIMTLVILFAAAAPLPVRAIPEVEETVCSDAWVVQLSSPLPAVLFGEDAQLFAVPVYEPQNLYRVTDPAVLEMLRQEEMLEWAEPDMEVELFADDGDADEVLPGQWQLDMLNTSRGDALGCYGQGIRVAVIDSGCASHAELSHALLPGYNFIADTDDITDNIGHGSFVCGLIAAADDGSGVTGAAPDAKIVPLKCFDNGVSTRVSVLTSAIYAAVDQYECRVISMSFGLKNYSKMLDAAISYAVENGTVCVAAVGNYGNSDLYYPAALPNVIGVGSVDSGGGVSYFSQRNESLTVAAPGQEVYSTTADGGFATESGTSFATPLISGLCARLFSANENLSPREVMQLLAASAKDLGDEGYDTEYGYGLADLEGAMELMLGGQEVFLSPFRVVGDNLFITLLNNASEELSGQCLLTRYQDGLMKDVFWEDVMLPPGDAVTVSVPHRSQRVKCFFWADLQDIAPITPYRECEVSS